MPVVEATGFGTLLPLSLARSLPLLLGPSKMYKKSKPDSRLKLRNWIVRFEAPGGEMVQVHVAELG